MSKQAILIAGPTASGKSGLAIELAKMRNGVVINADSMQVYDILQQITARPVAPEMDGIQHLMFGHINPADAYSVAKWLEEVKTAISDVRSQGKLPILVGGTGLYFKSALEGLSQIPPIDPIIRRELRDASLDDLGGLYRELQRLDDQGAAKLEPSDTQRIVRALEVVKSTGQALSHWQRHPKGQALLASADCEKIILMPDRALLHERIALRFNQMIEKGAMEEVRSILALNLDGEMPAMRAIGVSQLAAVINQRADLQQAIELSIVATRQYAKRQTTWFRHQFDESWQIATSANAYLSGDYTNNLP